MNMQQNGRTLKKLTFLRCLFRSPPFASATSAEQATDCGTAAHRLPPVPRAPRHHSYTPQSVAKPPIQNFGPSKSVNLSQLHSLALLETRRCFASSMQHELRSTDPGQRSRLQQIKQNCTGNALYELHWMHCVKDRMSESVCVLSAQLLGVLALGAQQRFVLRRHALHTAAVLRLAPKVAAEGF